MNLKYRLDEEKTLFPIIKKSEPSFVSPVKPKFGMGEI